MKSKIVILHIFFILFCFINPAYSQQQSIRVGVYNNYPKVFISENGEVAGIFPEIMNVIAEKEGWDVIFVEGTWNEGLQRLENGDIDVMVDVALSDERKLKYDFNLQSVLVSWGCMYSRTGNDINTILDLEGKTIAVMKNSILTDGKEGIVNLVELYGVNCTFVEVTDYYDVFSLIQRGEIDAGVTNRHFGAAFEDEYDVKKTNFIFYPTQLRLAFPKGSERSAYFIPRIDEVLREMKKDTNSAYYSILAKYNLYPKKGIPEWIIPLLIGLLGIVIFFTIVYLMAKWRIKEQTRALQSTNEVLKKEIEEHQTTLKELALSRENYRNFVENIPGLVYMYDQDEDGIRIPVIRTNRNEEFLGREMAEEIEKNYSSFFDHILPEDKEKMKSLSLEVENSGEEFNYEYRVKISQDKIKWFKSIGRVRLLPDGKRRWQGVILDIDERKKVEKELELYRNQLEELVKTRTEDLEKKTEELEKANIELTEADRLKSIFLASMSHELRTPLNSIIGFTGILLMGMVGDLTDEQRNQLTIVKQSAKHLLELINDILDISKIEANKVELHNEAFKINDVIEDVMKSFEHSARERGLEIQIQFDDNAEIYADLRRFKQIIFNLVGNAVKFTDKGEIRVLTKITDNEEIHINVSDTGIGIKDEDMRKLFEPFQQIDSSLTKKREGTGLGLHLTQKIIDLMDGTISVQSEEGKGSTFTVILPYRKEEGSNEESISH